ncbi:hypothetical protein [Chromobacterium violaceum]|uniref:hypothetical protein n=1 Tax=Chromobacterium violaceum TaxID=536 RepID=UPI00111C23BB|nr:hypothetical protein [Chromobacterium violaceum]MBX9268342.1 hypothetical protein [Chromobacterium violaceum]QRO31243.1 hypothetical protein I6K04_11920 [Chromobacterium violaceum]QRQ18956.1 hypothetical protein I6K03_10810 [Chromobacterium violaceum]
MILKGLTPSSNDKPKQIPVDLPPKVKIFVVGGAGDKREYGGIGPHHAARRIYDQILISYKKEIEAGLIDVNDSYKGYYELYGEENIKKIESQIPSRKTKIYLIGHSLGGWNSAHLCYKLTGKRYDVGFLLTLDPVGEGAIVRFFSDIYKERPGRPGADYWINLRYEQSMLDVIADGINPKKKNDSVLDFTPNWIADAGVKWNVDSRYDPDINQRVKINHGITLAAINEKLTIGQSAWEIMGELLKKDLS